jgi:putative copper export protein
MPNWLHLLVNFAYHLALALWIGGTIVLGALVAPALFRALPRHEAGAIFGPTLRKFARLRVAAIAIAIIAAAVKFVLWEKGATVWISLRWAALLVMAATVVYEIGFLESRLEARRVHLTPETPDSDPNRRAFNELHKRAEGLMKASWIAALAAMLLS